MKISGVLRYARSARWKVRVLHYDDIAGAKDRERLLGFWQPAGVIVEGVSKMPIEMREALRALPLVVLDPQSSEDLPHVTCDDHAVAAAAAHELFSARVSACLYVPHWNNPSWSRSRQEAFKDVVRSLGGKCHSFRWHKSTLATVDYYESLCRWLRKAPKPCGIFAASDYVAEVVLQCASRVGLKPRRDFALLGVDDDASICERCTPTLSSIIIDFERAGYLAAELLDSLLSGENTGDSSALFGVAGLRHRESTFVYRRSDDRVTGALKFIRQSAWGNCTVANVVAAMKCSRRLAELRFREVTGHSILDEILAVRVESAKYLLVHSSKSISGIAMICGYASANALRKVFEAATGMTPVEWRQKNIAQ